VAGISGGGGTGGRVEMQLLDLTQTETDTTDTTNTAEAGTGSGGGGTGTGLGGDLRGGLGGGAGGGAGGEGGRGREGLLGLSAMGMQVQLDTAEFGAYAFARCFGMSEAELRALKNLFERVDLDSSGSIDYKVSDDRPLAPTAR
jgi:hypothetical protein